MARAAALALVASSCACAYAVPSAYPQILTLAATQADALLAELNGAFTSYPSNGAMGKKGWLTSTSGGWTSGFWPAHLLNLYNLTGDAKWLAAGSAWSQGLAGQQFNTHTHDVGFMVFTPMVKLYDATGNATVRDIILQTATSLATRYSPIVGCTRSWDSKTGFEVIADNMMNLELLHWAARESGNATFSDIAVHHTNTMTRDLFQPWNPGCVWHLIVYNETNGDIISRSSTPQGLGIDTVWSRGQSWIVNGFTIAYRYTHTPAHLAQARAAADCFIRLTTACCGPASPYAWAPLWDFNTTRATGISVDTSAMMIATSGIIELSGYVPPADAARYLAFAKTVLDAVVAHHLFTPAEDDAIMRNGTVTYPLYGVPIIYGDYYLVQAVMAYDAAVAALAARK